jgi:response regulator RpfG family c-di-GMP phosphodiesterase
MTEKVNVLLVDDQPDKLLAYEVILHELNENLVKTSSAREALQYPVIYRYRHIAVDRSSPVWMYTNWNRRSIHR